MEDVNAFLGMLGAALIDFLDCIIPDVECRHWWQPWTCRLVWDCDWGDVVSQKRNLCDQHFEECCETGYSCGDNSCNAGLGGCFAECRAAFYGEQIGNDCLTPDYERHADTWCGGFEDGIPVPAEPPSPGQTRARDYSLTDPLGCDWFDEAPEIPEYYTRIQACVGTVDEWAAENGCIPRMQRECPANCTDACVAECKPPCVSQCADVCDQECHTADCADFCASLDLMGTCQSSCVAGCIDASRAQGPFTGPKYGRETDLNFNLVRIYDGSGDLYLENRYGDDLARPDFDAVVWQSFGGHVTEFHYRDLGAEADGSLTPPTSGPAADYTESAVEFETVDICPFGCGAPGGNILEDVYVPVGDLVYLFAPGTPTTGYSVAKSARVKRDVPATVFRIENGNDGALVARAISDGGVAALRGRPSFDVVLPSGTVTFAPAGDASYLVRGSEAGRAELLARRSITVLSDGSSRLRVYPGIPRGAVLITSGSCKQPFTAQRVATDSVTLVPTDACTADLAVAPLVSLIEDAGLAASVAENGSAALAGHNVFRATALLPTRDGYRWRGTQQMIGSSVADPAIADDARAKAARLAIAANVLAQPAATSRELDVAYAFHLAPGSWSRLFNTVVLTSLPTDDPTAPLSGPLLPPLCLNNAPTAARRGAGPSPRTATVALDPHGVAWTYYFDDTARLIRTVNHATGAVRSYQYGASGELLGVEQPLGDRVCFRYTAAGYPSDIFELPVPGAVGPPQPIWHRYTYTGFPVRVKAVYDSRRLTGPPAAVLESYDYDAAGNLTRATTAAGEVTRVEPVGGSGPDRAMPGRFIAPDGAVTLVEYDVASGTTARTTVDLYGADPLVSELVADAAGRPQWSRTPLGDTREWIWDGGRLHSVSRDADGLVDTVVLGYDADGRVAKVTRGARTTSFAYSIAGDVTTVQDVATDGSAPAATTCSEYGADGRLLERVLPEGDRIRYGYDGEGRVSKVEAGWWMASPKPWDDACPGTFEAGMAASGTLATVDYDANGRPYLATDARGMPTAFSYDGFGRVAIVATADGATYRAGYDALDNVLWTSVYAVAGFGIPYGAPQWGDVGLVAASTNTYDVVGRPMSEQAWHFDETGHAIGDGYAATTYSYELASGRISTTDDAGGTTIMQLDGAGRPVSIRLPTGDVISTAYVAGGRIIDREQPGPTPSGRFASRTELTAWGAPVRVLAGAPGALIEQRAWAYDARRRPVSSTEAGGLQTSVQVYDAFDRARRVVTSYDAGVAETVDVAWNRNGWPTDRWSTTDGRIARHHTDYDALGRPRRVVAPDDSNEYLHYVLASSLPGTLIDPKGVTHLFDYTVTGQVSRIQTLTTVGTVAQTREYRYDALGRITLAWRQGELPTTFGSEVTTQFGWDSLSNKRGEMDTSLGSTTALLNTHDGRGLPLTSSWAGVNVRRTHDALGRLVDIHIGSDNMPAVHFDYAGLGGPTMRTYMSGIQARFGYDALQRLVSIDECVTLTGAPIARWRYEIPRDGVPRLAGLRRSGGSERASLYQVDRGGRLRREAHGLAGLDRLTIPTATSQPDANTRVEGYFGTAPSHRYTLDGRHNWTSVTRPGATTVAPTIGSDDRYLVFGGASPAYDARGAVTHDGELGYVYDSFGEVVRVTGAKADMQYARDAFGRLIWERDARTGAITRYAFDGAQRIARVSHTGDIDVTIHGSDIDSPLVRVDDDGSRFYFHADRMGSIYLVSNAIGKPVEWYDYTAYGEMTIRGVDLLPRATSAIDNQFGFQGQRFDPATGLVDMRARLYKPTWGRFLAPDPIGLAGGPNHYAFVASAPLSFTDPFGLSARGMDEPWDIDAVDFDALKKRNQNIRGARGAEVVLRWTHDDKELEWEEVVPLLRRKTGAHEKEYIDGEDIVLDRDHLELDDGDVLVRETWTRLPSDPDDREYVRQLIEIERDVAVVGPFGGPPGASGGRARGAGRPRATGGSGRGSGAGRGGRSNLPPARVVRDSEPAPGGRARLPKPLRNKIKRIENATAAGGNRGIPGAVSRTDAMKLGRDFVGPDYRLMSNGRGYVSADGLRQFRFPSMKRGIDPMTGEPFSRTGVQVNFESRATANGSWTSNVHLDVIP